MCNRIVQQDRVVKPGEKARVLMKGPGGYFEIEYESAVLAGCATEEKIEWWRKQGEAVLIPAEGYGEKNKINGSQGFGELPPGSFIKGILMKRELGKDYRVLKIVTHDGGQAALETYGNERVPVIVPPHTGVPKPGGS